tara:strand:- start:620 stop:931 length:312 start_codon:yes stop_codon:yes gene_type:complete
LLAALALEREVVRGIVRQHILPELDHRAVDGLHLALGLRQRLGGQCIEQSVQRFLTFSSVILPRGVLFSSFFVDRPLPFEHERDGGLLAVVYYDFRRFHWHAV